MRPAFYLPPEAFEDRGWLVLLYQIGAVVVIGVLCSMLNGRTERRLERRRKQSPSDDDGSKPTEQ